MGIDAEVLQLQAALRADLGPEESVSPSLHPSQDGSKTVLAGSSGPAALISTTGTIELSDPGAFPPPGDPYLPGLEDAWNAVLPGSAENCGAPFRAVRACGCASAPVRDHCDRKACEHNYCVDRNRSRRARDIEDRMEYSRRGRSLIYTVFTVPPARREAAADLLTLKPRKRKDGTTEPREEWRWKRWLADLVQYLKDELGLDYAVERSDPAGGEHPDRWHPHINLLWIRKDGKGYLTPEQLGLLKARWKEIIGVPPEDPISVWTAFAAPQADARRRHWYSYMGRTWPVWEEKFPYHCRIKWLGKPAAAPEREQEKCCRKCGLEVATLRTGSEEAAAALAARGYEAVLVEMYDRAAELSKMARRRRPCTTGFRYAEDGGIELIR